MSTTPLLSIPPGMTSMSREIPMLSAANWMEFKDAMEIHFISACADYLVDATPSTKVPPECIMLDKHLIFHLSSRVGDELKYLVKAHRTSTLLAWIALSSHFQKSTMPRRVAAREQLYSVVHDTSLSIEHFIHSVTSAAKVLADLGHQVEDTEIKDILLMKLDDSYKAVSIKGMKLGNRIECLESSMSA